MIKNVVETLLIDGIPLILAITLHEAAHAYAAKRLGDFTAFYLGRVSLNPIKHIDPVGTLLIPIVLKLIGSPILFGYAKPVPVNFLALNHPKRDMIWVALAGPASNWIQAVLWTLLLSIFLATANTQDLLISMTKAGIYWNVILAVLNLFPLPPFDGGRILVGLLPMEQARFVSKIEPFGFFILLGLALSGLLSDIWMEPLIKLSLEVLELFMFQ
jgi:Zn-dependent protease